MRSKHIRPETDVSQTDVQASKLSAMFTAHEGKLFANGDSHLEEVVSDNSIWLAFFALAAAVASRPQGSSQNDTLAEEFSYSGAVIKGPLQNATVFLDYDGDGILGSGEPSVLTGADGTFEVTGNVQGLGFIVQTSETTIDTSSGEILDSVTLKAPAGSSVVTPATTIMEEAGITAEEVATVLGLPSGVDPTSFNPYSADADAETALAVEKISQQVMTIIKAVSTAVESAGADKASAFSVALETVVEIVKEKAVVAKANPESDAPVLDLSKTSEIAQVTSKVVAKIEETGIAAKEDFEAVKTQLDAAVSNVNKKITEVTDLTSEDSMAAFAVATELNAQVKAAVEAKGDPSAVIEFINPTAIENAASEKAEEIKEKIESGEVVTRLEPEPEPEVPTGGGGGGPVADTTAPNTPNVSQNGKVLTVTGEAAGTLKIFDGIDNVTAKFTVAEVGGTYTATAKSDQFDGTENLSLTTTLTDAAGNQSAASSAVTDAIDTTRPIAPYLAAFANTHNNTFDKGFVITAGADVAINIDGTLLDDSAIASKFTKTTASALDTYTAKASAFTGSEKVSVNATMTDSSGNQSDAATPLSLQSIDTVAPSALAIDATLEVDNIADDIEDDSVSVTGTTSGVEQGQSVLVRLSDGSSHVNVVATVAADGKWAAADADISSLANGTITITANTNDVAGNAASEATKNITLDNGALILNLATDTNIASDGITSDATINVSRIETNASWEYSVNGGTNWTTGTASSFELSEGSYADGVIKVRQKNNSGNVSNSGNLAGALVIDTTAPTTPNLSQNGKVLTVTGEAAGTLKIFDGIDNVTAKFTIAEAGGTYTATAKSGQFDGTENVSLTTTLTDAAGNQSAASSAVTDAIDSSSFAAQTLQKMYDGVKKIVLDASLFRMGYVYGDVDEADRLGNVLYAFQATKPTAMAAISVDNIDTSTADRAGLMAMAETTHNGKTVRVGTFAHDNLFADAVGRDPQSDGLARITANFLTELTSGKHQIGGNEPLRIMSITAGPYFDERQFDANDLNPKRRYSYIDAVDSNENEGRIHKDMGLYIDSINSGAQTQIYDFIEDIAGPNRNWGTTYDVIMVRPSINATYRDKLLDWAAETGGAVLFTYDTSPNRPDVVDPHPETTQFLQDIGITSVGKIRIAAGDYGPSRIDPFQSDIIKSALGIFIDTQGTTSSDRLVMVDDLSLPSEIYDNSGLKIADVTWTSDNASAIAANGAIHASGDATLTAQVSAQDGSTSNVNHYITAAKLLDAAGDPIEPGLRVEFIDWLPGKITGFYETDFTKVLDERNSLEIFDLKNDVLLKSKVTSDLKFNESTDPKKSEISSSHPDDAHVMLMSGYIKANTTGTHSLSFSTSRKDLMQVFIETDTGTLTALNSNEAIKNVHCTGDIADLQLTAGKAYRIVTLVANHKNSKAMSLQWKEPGDETPKDIAADNLIARPSVYPVSGRKDGNFFDFIDFPNDPWATEAAATANTDLNADTVWKQGEFDSVYPDVSPVQTSEDISLDLEYYQAPIQNLVLTDALIQDAKTVSLNVYDSTSGDKVLSLLNWSLGSSPTNLTDFATKVETKLQGALSDTNISVTAANGVVTITDPNNTFLFEEFIVGKNAALAPETFDITQTKEEIWDQGNALRTDANSAATIDSSRDASGAFIGSLANASRFSFKDIDSEFELNNVKIYSSKTERFIDDATWIGENDDDYANTDKYDADWKNYGALERTLNYYTGYRWDVQSDGGANGTAKIIYKVHKGGTDGWELVTPALAEIHTGSVYDDLIENVSEAGRKGSTISLGDITGQISVDATDLAASSPFAVKEQPLFGSVTIANDGSYRYNPTDGRFQGFDQFHIEVTDVAGGKHVVPVTIGTNDGVVEETSATAVIEFKDPSYTEPSTTDYNTNTAPENWTFQDLFFAQVAVQRPDSPYLNLVEGRWVKLKLNVSLSSGTTAAVAPKFEVVVKDISGNEIGRRVLIGPKDLPAADALDLPSKTNLATGVGHNDNDSYTAPIPGDWIAPGHKFEILANGVNIATRDDFPLAYANDSDDIIPNIVGGGTPDISIGHFTLGAYNDTFLYVSTNDFAADILAAVPAQKVELLYRSGSTLVETVRNRTMWDSPSIISSDQSIAAGAATYIETFSKPFGWGYPGWATNLASAVKKANFMSPLPGGINYPDWMYASLSPDVGGGVGGGQTGSGNTATTATIHEFLGHGGGIGHPTENAYSFAYNWKVSEKNTTPLDQKTELQSSYLASYSDGTTTVGGPFKVFKILKDGDPFWSSSLTIDATYAIVPKDDDFIAVKVTVSGSNFAQVANETPVDLKAEEASALVALSQDLRFIITDNDTAQTEYMKQGSLGDNWYYDQNNDIYVTNYYIDNLTSIIEQVRAAVKAANSPAHLDRLAAEKGDDQTLKDKWTELKTFVVEVPTPDALGPVTNLAEVLDIASRLPTIYATKGGGGEYKYDGENKIIEAEETLPTYSLRTGPMSGSQGTGSAGREDDSGLTFARFSDAEIDGALVDRFSNMMQWRPNEVEGVDSEDGGYAGDGYYQYFGLDQDIYTVADLTGVDGDTRKIVGIRTNLSETNVVDFYADEAETDDGHNHTDSVADDHTHEDDVADDHDHNDVGDHLGNSNIFLTGDKGKKLNTTAADDAFTEWTTGQDNVRIAGGRTNQSVISFELMFDDNSTKSVNLVKGWQTVDATNHQGTIEALMPHQVGVEIYSVIFNIQDTHGHDHERGAEYYADVPMFAYKTVGNLPSAYYDYLKPNSGIVFDAVADYALRVTYQTATGLVTDHIQVPANNSGGINLPVKGELVRMDLVDATGGKQAYLENKVISSFVNPNALANLVLGGNDWFGVISDVELPTYHNGHKLTWSASASDFIDLPTGDITLDKLTKDSSITATWTENGTQHQTIIGLAALSDELLNASLFPHGSILVDDVDLPTSVFGYDVKWTTSDTSIVGADGVLTQTAGGSATLTAKLKNSDGDTVRQIDQAFDVVPNTQLADGLQFDVFDLGSVYASADIAGGKDFNANEDKLGFVALLQGGLDFDNTNKLFEGTARNVVWHAQDARDFDTYAGAGYKLFGDNEAKFREFVNAAYRGRVADTQDTDGNFVDKVIGDVAENSLYVFSGLLCPTASDDYHFNLDMRVEGSFAIEVDGKMHHFQSTNNLKTQDDPIALQQGKSYKIWASVLMSRETVGANNVDRYDTVDLKWSTADQPGDSDWSYIPDTLFKHTQGSDMWANGNAPYATTNRVQFINETTDDLFVDNTDFIFDIAGTDFGEFTQFVDNSDVLNASGTEDSTKMTNVTLDGDLVLDFSEFDTSAVPDNGSLTLDLIVADAISGSFDSQSTMGLDTDFSATIAVVDGTSGEDDILRLTIG